MKNTDTDLLDLSKLEGKVVCFKDLVFSLLPRMVFGMYYNMSLTPGCEGSAVFQAFRQHMTPGSRQLVVLIGRREGKQRDSSDNHCQEYATQEDIEPGAVG